MKNDAPCILDQTNASRKTLDLIADKWTILVLFALRNGKRRFAELRPEGVSRKDRCKVALKRWGTSDEVAQAAGFLLSEDSSNITGTELIIDGGVRLN